MAAVATAPSDRAIVYLAAYGLGGVYRSDDGGISWYPAMGGLESVAPIALAVHPQDP